MLPDKIHRDCDARCVGRRRRLTLAPEPGSGGSGSRFAVLSPVDDGGLEGASEIASQVALEVLEGGDLEDGGDWTAVGRRPGKSEEGLLQEFWEYVGFPTPVSRPWEVPASSPVAGMSVDHVCRSPEGQAQSESTVLVPVEKGPAAVEV